MSSQTMLPATPASCQLTDSSDSSSSTDNDVRHHNHHHHHLYNEPFVNIAECTSLHEGRQQISTILPVNIDTLFHTLYARSKFLDDFHASRRIFDIEHTDWRLEEETNKRRRTFKCKMPIKASIGPKISCVTEIQTLRECSVPGSLYSIDITSWNENIPYSDVFTIYVHHCLVRTVDDHTMFSVYLHVKFRKSIFSVIRALIERTTYSGVDDFHTDLALQLSRHFCTPPVRHKRHKRNHSRSQALLGNEASAHTVDPDDPHANASSAAAANGTTSHADPNGHKHTKQKPTGEKLQLKTQKSSAGGTGIATFSKNELFIQHKLTGSPVAGQRRSTAFVLLMLMIAVSLLNVALFVRLHSLTAPSKQAPAATAPFSSVSLADLQRLREQRPNDVDRMSADDWLRMFYAYHIRHQRKIGEMRQLLVATITSLKQMEDNMMSVMATFVPVNAPDVRTPGDGDFGHEECLSTSNASKCGPQATSDSRIDEEWIK